MYRIQNLIRREGLGTDPNGLIPVEYLPTSDSIRINIFAAGCHSVRGLDDVSSRFP